MTSRNALVLINGSIQELPSGDTLNGAGGAASISKGTATIDFGNGSTDTTAVVTGQSTITTSNLVEAWIFPSNTANNTADNHWVEDITVLAGNIVDNTGFTIYAKSNTGKAHGQYTVAWTWI